MTAKEQIGKLAQFIIQEVDGEPSRDEGAIDTAIRIIRELKNELDIKKIPVN